MNTSERIAEFLNGSPHAVVGASRDRSKYGNRVLRAYMQNDRPVLPVHPSEKEIEGLKAWPDLASLPEPVHGVSVITPPKISESIVEQAGEAGIQYIWFQPGAESGRAVSRANELGMTVISGGPCILIELGFRDH